MRGWNILGARRPNEPARNGAQPPTGGHRFHLRGWFGPGWNADINRYFLPSAVPAGQRCRGCPRVIEDGDQGVFVFDGQDDRESPWHLACWRAVPLP